MTKEEFEAIESVNNYLRDQACEFAIQLGFNNAPTLEECNFWIKSYSKFSKYYSNVCKQYYNLDK